MFRFTVQRLINDVLVYSAGMWLAEERMFLEMAKRKRNLDYFERKPVLGDQG
jgi:hypothetical protein